MPYLRRFESITWKSAMSVQWFIAVMEVPFGLEGITKGSFADGLWMQPVIISLYFGIALPFLNRWISEINQNTATSQQQPDENGEEEPVPVVAKLKERNIRGEFEQHNAGLDLTDQAEDRR